MTAKNTKNSLMASKLKLPPTDGRTARNDGETSLVYGVSVPTIQRWRSQGRKAGRPAPLHDPAAMAGWWDSMISAGHYSKPCPMSITEAAEKTTGDAPGDDDSAVHDPGLQAILKGLNAPGADFDYSDGLHIAKRNLQVTDYLLQRALKSDDHKSIGPLQRRLNEASDSYRSLMRDKAKIQADAGETLLKSEVRAALLEIHQNIPKRFRWEFRAIFPLLSEKGANQVNWNTFVDDTVDRICEGLRATRFAA